MQTQPIFLSVLPLGLGLGLCMHKLVPTLHSLKLTLKVTPFFLKKKKKQEDMPFIQKVNNS